jgi:menaquinone-dependent protoporphyrinogen oxidase
MGKQKIGLQNLIYISFIVLLMIFIQGCGNKNASIEASFGKGDKMSKKVLVAYASFSGSTAETAVFIGKKLAEKGMTTEVKPVEKIKSIEGYDAVIIGSAVMMGKLKQSVVKFTEKYKEGLGRVPIALFLVCLTMAKDTPETRKTASGYLEPLKAIVKPVSEGLFPGRVRYKDMPYPQKLLTFMPAFKKGVPEMDAMDWVKTEKWVNEIAGKI